MKILAGARSSPLSRAQFEEVRTDPLLGPCELLPVWVETTGDRDKKTSLRHLGLSDFFTKELDEMLLSQEIRVAIHSAKDLPDPIAEGLALVALTKGVDSRDSLVFRSGEDLYTLPKQARIATSSVRREDLVRSLRSDLEFVDLRGTIGERLALLQNRDVDALVIAEAAILRLRLTHLTRRILPGTPALHQGRLAILARRDDREMQTLFAPLDYRLV